MSRNAFSKWFNEIDTDGNNTVSLDELIGAFCHLFKIEQVKTDDY
jgi:Ca2+-binding EF-hand superfamily protein